MLRPFKKFAVISLHTALLGLMANAQEFGGDLGSSGSVFRPKNPSSSASKKPVRAPKAAKSSRREVSNSPVKTSAKTSTRTASSASSNNARSSKPTANSAQKFANYEEAISSGNDARDERHYAAAESAYQQAYKMALRDSRAPYGLGNLYADQQMWVEAEKYYRQAIFLDKKNADAHIALSYVLVQPNGGGNLSERFVEAERAARQAIALEGTNPLAYDQLGAALEARGIIDEAENAYKTAISLDKTYSVAYAHYGRLMRKRGNIKAANAAFEQADKLAADIPSMILFAEILQSEQRLAESEKILRRVLLKDPNNPTALILLGRSLSVTNADTEAREILEKSIRISPRSFSPYYLLGGILLKQGNIARAEQTYLKALSVASESEKRQLIGTYGFTGTGDLYMKNNRRADALRAYRKALEIDPKNESILSKIAAAGGDK